jgi:hypothetical protein
LKNKNIDEISIVLGTDNFDSGLGKLTPKVRSFQIHPKWELGKPDFDIGIILLTVYDTYNLLPVCLPSSPDLSPDTYNGESLIFAGWGIIDRSKPMDPNLTLTLITAYSLHECNIKLLFKNRLSSATMCAGKGTGIARVRPCYGTSGGGLLKVTNGQYVLIGVLNSGIGCDNKYPEIFVRIEDTDTYQWIKTVMN